MNLHAAECEQMTSSLQKKKGEGHFRNSED